MLNVCKFDVFLNVDLQLNRRAQFRLRKALLYKWEWIITKYVCYVGNINIGKKQIMFFGTGDIRNLFTVKQ